MTATPAAGPSNADFETERRWACFEGETCSERMPESRRDEADRVGELRSYAVPFVWADEAVELDAMDRFLDWRARYVLSWSECAGQKHVSE